MTKQTAPTRRQTGAAGRRGDDVRSDLWVELTPREKGGIEIDLRSRVDAYYGDSIRDQARGVLEALWRNPFTTVDIERMRLTVDVSPEVRRYQLQSIHFDRRTLRPGQVLEVDCVLRRHRGESETVRLRLQMPDRIPHDARLIQSSAHFQAEH